MIIAQLSDIHADGSRKSLDRLEKVLDWLRPLKPDALIVSGDLAEAEQRRSYKDIRERLERLGAPFSVVPGNVDDRDEMRRAFGDLFPWEAEGPLNSVLEVGDLRLIGLDVTVPSAHYGDYVPVGPFFAATLAASEKQALVFQHQHPFMTGIDGKDRNFCHGHEELALVLSQYRDRVLGLTCGHVHRAMFTRFAGLPATMAPSIKQSNALKLDGKSAEAVDPPGLLIHHWSDNRLVSHVVMVD